jgi:hypothetical protein
MPPATCGERECGGTHRCYTTPLWNRSRRRSARKVRRLPLGACGSRGSPEADSPITRRTFEQRAAQVGLSFIYDVLYRYEPRAATHPTMVCGRSASGEASKGAAAPW